MRYRHSDRSGKHSFCFSLSLSFSPLFHYYISPVSSPLPNGSGGSTHTHKKRGSCHRVTPEGQARRSQPHTRSSLNTTHISLSPILFLSFFQRSPLFSLSMHIDLNNTMLIEIRRKQVEKEREMKTRVNARFDDESSAAAAHMGVTKEKKKKKSAANGIYGMAQFMRCLSFLVISSKEKKRCRRRLLRTSRRGRRMTSKEESSPTAWVMISASAQLSE